MLKLTSHEKAFFSVLLETEKENILPDLDRFVYLASNDVDDPTLFYIVKNLKKDLKLIESIFKKLDL